MTLSRIALFAAACLAFPACGDLDLGGGGDADPVNFSRGYAFVRDGDIYVVDASNYDAAKRVTNSGSNSDPAITPDGRTIVFVHTDLDGQSSIRRVSSGGSAETVVIPPIANRKLAQPSVADNGRLAFVSRPDASVATVTLASLDGSGEREIAQSLRDFSPSFYPDGNYILAATGADTLACNELVKIELTAGVRASRASQLAGLEKRAVVSPDGRLVAFEMKAGGTTRIYVINESGELSSMRAVARTGGNETSPTWISSTRLGFTSDAGGGLSNLYEVDVTGSVDDYKLVVADAQQGCYGGR